MRIKLSETTINVEEYRKNLSSSNFIFLLHGFTGSSLDWNEIIPGIHNNYRVAAIDLIGHGKSDSPSDISLYTTESLVGQIYETIKKFTDDKIILAGYSMGGRAALSFAAKHPEMIKGLIIESSSPGIKEEKEKLERKKKDEKLASFIENHSIEEFVDYWMNIDLFKSQKNLTQEKLRTVRESKLVNNKIGLANSLRGFSQGIMPPLYNNLKNISTKTLLISGRLDPKYTNINSDLTKLFPDAVHAIIENAGHNTHLEKPSSFINVINNFLNEF